MSDGADLTGNLSFLGFADLLQLLGSIAARGILKVYDDFGIPLAVFFKNGEIVNAVFKDLKGEPALFVPFSWSSGHFLFKSSEVDCEHLIKNNLTGLILEGLRLLDEGKIDGAGKDLSFNTKIPLLRGKLVDYAEVVDEEFFEKNEIIVKEGRYGAWIWVILDGLVQVEKNISGKSVPVMHLGKGGFIGSIASFARGDRPRSATVRAMTSVQLGVLDAQALSKEYTAYSDLLRNYFVCIDERLIKITEAYTGLYIHGLSGVKDLKDVQGLMKEHFRGGKLGIVETGCAELYLESKGKLLNLGKVSTGDIVGELPFVEISRDYSFYLAGDKDFAIRPFDQKLLADEFLSISENVRKMVEFAGLTLSVTAYNLSETINSKNIDVAQQNKTEE